MYSMKNIVLFNVIIPFIYKNITTINVHLSLPCALIDIYIHISHIYIHMCILKIKYYIVINFSYIM